MAKREYSDVNSDFETALNADDGDNRYELTSAVIDRNNPIKSEDT